MAKLFRSETIDPATVVNMNLTHNERRLNVHLHCMLNICCDETATRHLQAAGEPKGFDVWRSLIGEHEPPRSGRLAPRRMKPLRHELCGDPRSALDAFHAMGRWYSRVTHKALRSHLILDAPGPNTHAASDDVRNILVNQHALASDLKPMDGGALDSGKEKTRVTRITEAGNGTGNRGM